MGLFSKQRALVTGGSRGIGRAIAKHLLEEGCEVLITGSTPNRQGWWDDMELCSYKGVNFSEGDKVKSFCEEVSSQDFNLLVNNAGAFHSECVESFPVEKWNELLAVNLKVPMQLIGALASGMRAQGGGRIVNVGSIAGIVTRAGLAGYSSSKAALVSLTRSAALDLAKDQILVNCLCPAYTETDMLSKLDEKAKLALLEKVPLGRFCQPDEVAKAASFLLSPDNTFITGQTLVIDGGVILQ